MPTPFVAAAGTWGYGLELQAPAGLSAIITKSITLTARLGHPLPRMVEVPSGVINAIGLQNVGIDVFIRDFDPRIRKANKTYLVSLYAESLEEWASLAARANQSLADAFELNISCPNVIKSSETDEATYVDWVKVVRKTIQRPIWVKLSPKQAESVDLLKSLTALSIEGLVFCNTYPATSFFEGHASLSFQSGGLSGPAIRPMTLERLRRVSTMPLATRIASGGIARFEDILEYRAVQAEVFQIGSFHFRNPWAAADFSRLWTLKGLR